MHGGWLTLARPEFDCTAAACPADRASTTTIYKVLLLSDEYVAIARATIFKQQ
jgi:hypothetical protein